MTTKAIGYEVRCSKELAKKLGAHFYGYAGDGALHWGDGYLWFILHFLDLEQPGRPPPPEHT